MYVSSTHFEHSKTRILQGRAGGASKPKKFLCVALDHDEEVERASTGPKPESSRIEKCAKLLNAQNFTKFAFLDLAHAKIAH